MRDKLTLRERERQRETERETERERGREGDLYLNSEFDYQYYNCFTRKPNDTVRNDTSQKEKKRLIRRDEVELYSSKHQSRISNISGET